MNTRSFNLTRFQKIIAFVFIFLLGLFLGNIADVPYLSIDSHVDVSALVSILALFAATFVVPMIINNYVANNRNINTTTVKDIDELIANLTEIKDYLAKIYSSNEKVTEQHRRMILSKCTEAQNQIDALCELLNNDKRVPQFQNEVSLTFNKDVRPAYTDHLHLGEVLAEQASIEATKSMGRLISYLKKARYAMYS